jgi:tetratricopeptide (TPR) repeat protein
LGIKHISTLTTVYNFGDLYVKQGKLNKTEKMYRWALEEREKALGAEHISILDTGHNLGYIYATQGKLREAEQMY